MKNLKRVLLILSVFPFIFIFLHSCKTSNPAMPAANTATITQTVFQSPTATFTATATSTPKPFDHITIKAANGAPLGNQDAGVPFNISMTAWADAGETVIAQAFSGMPVALKASNSYSDSEYCMSPTLSIYFTNGYAYMPVTFYRASDTDVTIEALYGTLGGTSSGFKVASSYPYGFLWLLDGMTHKPGLNHVGIPGYQGFSGAPDPVQAGVPFNITLMLVDSNYNRVTNTAAYYPKITASDTLATVNGVLCSAGVYVTVTAGIFTSSDAVFPVIPAAGFGYLTAEHGFLGNKTAPPINIQ